MPTFKLLIREDRPNSRGECPIYLRITHNRKTRYKKVGLSIKPKYWNEGTVRKSHPTSKSINIKLHQILGEAKQAVTKVDVLSAESIKNFLDGVTKESFIDYAKQFAEGLEYHDRKNMNTAITQLQKFQKQVAFYELTPEFLGKWDRWMKTEKENARNTRNTYIRKIGRVLNHAMKHDVIRYDSNPFATGKIELRWEKPDPTKLTPDELKRFKNANLPKRLHIYRDIFLFALYCDGMRVTDVLLLRDGNVKDGLLNYTMSKNGKTKNITLPKPAKDIWGKHEGGRYHFPLLTKDYEGDRLQKELDRLKSNIHHKLNDIATLAEIDKKIGMHVARHTFAWLADEKGWSLTEIQHALDHSSITETRDYIGRLRSDRLTEKRNNLFDDS